jgi:hypothetical protein
MSDSTEKLKYDPILMDPLEDLFDKIHEARGGEMILIHIPKDMDIHTAKCLSVMKSENSTLGSVLPSIIKEIEEDE